MARSPKKVNQIFICYRREDSAAETGRIYDRLVRKFGKKAIFKDVDSITLGTDFRLYIDSQVGKCDVVLVVIGDRWLSVTNESGNRRLDDARDFVRIEIESALRREIPVIPLWVRNVDALSEESLPDTLQALAYRHGMAIGHDPHFHADVNRLIKHLLKNIFAPLPSPQSETDLPELGSDPSEKVTREVPPSETNATKWAQATTKFKLALEAIRSWRFLSPTRGEPKTKQDNAVPRRARYVGVERLVRPDRRLRVFLSLFLIYILFAVLTTDLYVPSIFQNVSVLEPALWGLALGSTQAWLLRLPSVRWWILLTVIGATGAGLICNFLGVPWEVTWGYVYNTSNPFVDGGQATAMILLALRWSLVGLGQWLVLRKLASAAWLWPVTTIAAALVYGAIMIEFSHEVRSAGLNSRLTYVDFFAMYVVGTGVLLGTAQSLCLIYFRNKADAIIQS